MSGRSAHVRKEKTKVKDGATIREEPVKANNGLMSPNSLIGDFPLPTGSRHDFEHDLPYRNNTQQKFSSAKSIASSGSDERHRPIDDMAYARVRKPQVPVLDVSGIEKSSFRSLMDKRSENARNGLAKVFGKKKKTSDAQEVRPATAATVRPASHELDADNYELSPPPYIKPRLQQQPSFDQMQDFGRPGPPQGALPPVPQPGQLKRWLGSGRSPQPWNKLRKDPELWDPNGDTLVYFGHESQQPRPPPSFRLSSHILEGTESRFLVTLLREGATDEMNAFSMPPSPISSPGMRPAMPIGRSHRGMPTPPLSENSLGTFDGQISYEIYFPSPPHLSHPDSLRYQVTTRNVFAILYHASLVGMNLFQALNDLHERLENWMPSDCDNAATIIEYIVSRGIDDVRNDPATAAALLAWSEGQGVRWEEGWRESYVHCAGMYNKLEQVPDYRFITPITRALLERASLEVQVRVQTGEERLADFDYGDMWPMMSSHPPPARASFERLQKFFCQHYENSFGSWPPANNLPPLGSEDQWLTRGLAQKLQKDFGALYDYLVDREITWECSEANSGRKWNITSQKDRAFDADTSDLPFTDILVAFDNRHKYPHIPHPYPLVPESIPVKNLSRENLFKASKKPPPKEDKIAERRAALAYTESTNIYILGSDFATNDLVDAFVRFEKTDKPAEVDPYAARRGRWVLIYGILQTLATIGVDTPNLRYTNDVSYYLSPKLRGTPPWKGSSQNVDEAGHENSYCWAVPRTWADGSPPPDNETPERLSRQKTGGGRSILSSKNSTYMSSRSSAAASDSGFQSDAGSEAGGRRNGSRQGRRPRGNGEKERDGRESAVSGYSGYSSSGYARGPGFEKVEEWPIREESMRIRQMAKAVQPVEAQQQHGSGNKRGESPLLIKDFDDYNF